MATDDASIEFWDRINKKTQTAFERASERQKARQEEASRRSSALRAAEDLLVRRMNELGSGAQAGPLRGLASTQIPSTQRSRDPWNHHFGIEWSGPTPRSIVITINEQSATVSWAWYVKEPARPEEGIMAKDRDRLLGQGESVAAEAPSDLIDRLIESLTDQDAFEERRAPEITVTG